MIGSPHLTGQQAPTRSKRLRDLSCAGDRALLREYPAPQLEETLAVLSHPEALADIREADQAYRDGAVVRGADAVRALRQ